MEVTINLTSCLVAALSAFVLGGVWYGPVFGSRWQVLVGLKDEDLAQGTHPAKIFAAAFLLTLVQAVILSALIPAEAGVKVGVIYALLAGLGFVVTAFGINYLFSRRPMGLYAIDAGYNLLQFVLMGAIIGAMS